MLVQVDAEIDAFISFLFELKYGVVPTAEQTELGRIFFWLRDRDLFVADFIEDTEILSFDGFYYTEMGFEFSTAPSDAYLREADVASIYINFLKDVPDDSVISEKADMLFAAFIDEVLASRTYSGRFSSTFAQLENRASGWKRSDWLGWFNTDYEPWVYHAELGWVAFSVTGQDEQNLWMYDHALGWIWTQTGAYPHLYNASNGHWLYFAGGSYQPGKARWFFDYSANGWIQQ